MAEFTWGSAKSFAAAITGGETTAGTVIDQALARIAQRNPAPNAGAAKGHADRRAGHHSAGRQDLALRIAYDLEARGVVRAPQPPE
jgi:Asp-tRNA(Asn)/Glu-tRNA(Gln) amidotransferase A subunit family amidase